MSSGRGSCERLKEKPGQGTEPISFVPTQIPSRRREKNWKKEQKLTRVGQSISIAFRQQESYREPPNT